MHLSPPTLAADTALFLDFDGTLVGFSNIPKHVKLDPAIVPVLMQLREKLGGALAIVTGREISNITDLFSPLVLPVAGSHGAERRRPDGQIELPGEEIKEQASRIAADMSADLGDIEGLIIEHKVYSVALHYRNAPEAAERVHAVANKVLSQLPGWVGTPGKMVIEVRPAAYSKGGAVEAFMAEAPFSGRVPVFIGDDTTDEAGMSAAKALGGFGIKVGTGDSVADYRLADPAAVHAYLIAAAKD